MEISYRLLRFRKRRQEPFLIVDCIGHGEKRFDRRTYIADWFMKQLKAG